MLALLVSEALVLTLMLALRVLAVDHDDVVDAEGTDGGAGEEVAVDVFAAALLAFARKISLQMRKVKSPILFTQTTLPIKFACLTDIQIQPVKRQVTWIA